MKMISTNPSRNYEVLGEVEMSTRQDIVGAVTKAHTAQPAWAALTLEERCKAVRSFASVVKEHADELARIIAQEIGQPLAGAQDDVAQGLNDLETYCAMAEKWLAPQITHETDTAIHRVRREPRGVIAAICPWNFPFTNVAWQCGQALLAGNTVIYKNSEENPLFAQLLEKLVAESGMPAGTFNIVYGDGKVGEMLARSDVDMISFTGSLDVGRKLTVIGAEKFIPVVTELGGSSPCVVFEDTTLTDDLVGYVFARRFYHTGQYCTSVKRLIVHESKFDELVDKLSKLAATKKLGDALDPTTDLGSLVAERQVVRLEAQVRDAVETGAKVVIGGNRPEGLKGAYYLPTILTNVTRNMRVWSEETFGPVLPVVSFKTEAEAVALANDTQYGLGAHLLTSDKERFERIAPQIQSGMVAQNQVRYLHPKNPFGGYKHSGMGRENGEFGFHEVTQIKLISEEK
jgi:acyl-CoA reductase-like NAD-dependent aldehyde dehydrogenase